MLEEIQKELQAICSKYPQVRNLTFFPAAPVGKWNLQIEVENQKRTIGCDTLLEVVEFLEETIK